MVYPSDNTGYTMLLKGGFHMIKRSARSRARRVLDDRLKMMPDLKVFAVPNSGWIRSIRESLGMSAADLGARLKIAPQSVLALETSEANEHARIGTLKKVAEELDCTFVYAFIPRSSLEESIRSQAEDLVSANLANVAHNMHLEDQSVDLTESVREELVKEIMESSRLWKNQRQRGTR
jgi:predicted DNA-binding mobile mystery protein A